MGLPGSGKTHFSSRLQKHLACSWFNADEIRRMSNDWEFSDKARLRQAERMKRIADFEALRGATVICDFVCPTKQTRDLFSANIVIFMDTIKEGRFEDTNKVFEKPNPKDVTLWINHFLSDEAIEEMSYWLQDNYNV